MKKLIQRQVPEAAAAGMVASASVAGRDGKWGGKGKGKGQAPTAPISRPWTVAPAPAGSAVGHKQQSPDTAQTEACLAVAGQE